MVDQNKIDKVREIAFYSRQKIVELSTQCTGTMHWGGSLSCVDILSVLYGDIISNNHEKGHRDKFILSKGHAALGLYAVLASAGIISQEKLLSYRENGTQLTELAEYNDELGIDCSGGSLGLGLAYGTGLALLEKKETLGYKTYVMLGDGELNEGSVWESVMFASQHNLDKLCVIVDKNQLQSDGCTNSILDLGNLSHKFAAFGWNVTEIDGHSYDEIFDALLKENFQKPHVIIANTIKGKGISFMQGDNSWHDRKINKEEYLLARKEVGLSAES